MAFLLRCSSGKFTALRRPAGLLQFSMLRYGSFSTAANATEHPTLQATARSIKDSGSRKSRKLRQAGLVPGVLYGVDTDRNDMKRLITLQKKDILNELRVRRDAFENTIYNLVVDDEEGGSENHLVTPRQAQFNPITHEPLSVNFLRYSPGIRMQIPIRFINEDKSQDLRRNCFLVRVNEYIDCVCEADVPQHITVDLAEVSKGDVLRLNSLLLPPKVRFASTVNPDFVVAVVKGGRG